MSKNHYKNPIACFLSFLVLVGCATGNMIKPPFDTVGKKIVFVPLRERDLYYFESTLGMEVSALLASVVSSKSEDLKIVDIAPAVALIKGKNPDTINWQEVGKTTGADYVVLGYIKTLRARDPVLHVNCYRGLFQAEITVIRTATGTEVMRESVIANYPHGRFGQEFLSVLETTEAEVIQKVKEQGVKKMAEFFYPHPPPED